MSQTGPEGKERLLTSRTEGKEMEQTHGIDSYGVDQASCRLEEWEKSKVLVGGTDSFCQQVQGDRVKMVGKVPEPECMHLIRLSKMEMPTCLCPWRAKAESEVPDSVGKQGTEG